MSSKLARAALLAASVLPLAAEAAKAPVTIDAVLQESQQRRGLGPVAWSPDGESFVLTEGGSLQLYSTASGKKRSLVALAELKGKARKVPEAPTFDWTNRRVSQSDVQWFPDGKRLLVLAGGDLFVVDARKGSFEQLTDSEEAEADPKLSPDGRLVSFRRQQDLYTLDVDSHKLHRLTQDGSPTLLNGQLDWVYPEELDLRTAHWWSPDGKSVAYLQSDVHAEPIYPQVSLLKPRGLLEPQRYPKAGDPNAEVRLGVVPAQGGPTRWMNLGEPRDFLMARVAWLPDSKQVAALRLPRVQNKLDLMIADASSGQSRVALHEEDPYWINVEGDIQFTDNQLLWTSERSGFRHLYQYDLDGRLVRQLTSGEWQVNGIPAIDRKNKRILFTSTEASALEQQLYSIGFDGSGKRRLTEGTGTHSIEASPDGSVYLDTFSNRTTPPSTMLCRADGSRLRVHREADEKAKETYDLLPIEFADVHASDGTLLHAQLIKPAGFDPKMKYPAVVMVYGGPHAQMVSDRWAGSNWDQVLAHKGFVVWSLDNRGSFGRGHSFETAVYHKLGAVELADQKEGVDALVRMGFVDARRIGLYGWSYGGFMTLNIVTHAPALIHAAIAGAPVTSWYNYDTIYTERYMGLPEDNQDAFTSTSPQKAAGQLQAKLLIIHNIEDDNVHFANTMQMSEALEKAGKQFRLLLYPLKTHGVSGELRRNLLEQTTAFFEENLR